MSGGAVERALPYRLPFSPDMEAYLADGGLSSHQLHRAGVFHWFSFICCYYINGCGNKIADQWRY